MTLCGKIRFDTRAQARLHLRQMRGHGASLDGLRVYKCVTGCDGWHLGHLPRNVLKGKISRGDVYRESR